MTGIYLSLNEVGKKNSDLEIYTLIKMQIVVLKSQVIKWVTCLIPRYQEIPSIYKDLDKLRASVPRQLNIHVLLKFLERWLKYYA